jgi:hypothetical protein
MRSEVIVYPPQLAKLRDVVAVELTPRLLAKLSAWRLYAPGATPAWTFPQRAGSYLTPVSGGVTWGGCDVGRV